jgi:hypothetical protein
LSREKQQQQQQQQHHQHVEHGHKGAACGFGEECVDIMETAEFIPIDTSLTVSISIWPPNSGGDADAGTHSRPAVAAFGGAFGTSSCGTDVTELVCTLPPDYPQGGLPATCRLDFLRRPSMQSVGLVPTSKQLVFSLSRVFLIVPHRTLFPSVPSVSHRCA